MLIVAGLFISLLGLMTILTAREGSDAFVGLLAFLFGVFLVSLKIWKSIKSLSATPRTAQFGAYSPLPPPQVGPINPPPRSARGTPQEDTAQSPQRLLDPSAATSRHDSVAAVNADPVQSYYTAAWKNKLRQSKNAAEQHDYVSRVRDANHSPHALSVLDKLTRQDYPELLTLNPAVALSATESTSQRFRNDVYIPTESDLHAMADELGKLPQILDESTALQAAIVVRTVSGLTNPTLYLPAASLALAVCLLDGLDDAVYGAFQDVRTGLQPDGPNALDRGRERLNAQDPDPRIRSFGPVIVGRELLLRGYTSTSRNELRTNSRLAAEVFEHGVQHPDANEYPIGYPQDAVADALMWAGITRGLLGDSDRASAHLERSYDLWTKVGNLVKSGRCAEELAELQRAHGGDGGVWFAASEDSFRAAGRDDRVALVRETVRGGSRHPSTFFLQQHLQPAASTVLGSSTADEIRAQLS